MSTSINIRKYNGLSLEDVLEKIERGESTNFCRGELISTMWMRVFSAMEKRPVRTEVHGIFNDLYNAAMKTEHEGTRAERLQCLKNFQYHMRKGCERINEIEII